MTAPRPNVISDSGGIHSVTAGERSDRVPPVSVASTTVTVRPVASKRDLKAFIDLPFRLHQGTEWVPPLKLERKILLSRKQNPFFTHGEAEYFLAERDGKVVGRITGQVDHAFNEFHNHKWGSFGFIEFEDDQEILEALLTAAGDWVAERGMDRMIGPIDFHMNNEAGLLVEGYDVAPIILQPWHPPYYLARFEQAGLTKAMDLLMWSLQIEDRDKVHPAIFEAARRPRRSMACGSRRSRAARWARTTAARSASW